MLLSTRSSLFDDFFQDDFFAAKANHLMSTDIKEEEHGYEIDINIPGFSKEDLNMELEQGYLTVTASHNSTNEKKDDEGKIIRQERYSGKQSRSFYVGEGVKVEDIKAAYTNGVLSIQIPKKEALETKQYITIE